MRRLALNRGLLLPPSGIRGILSALRERSKPLSAKFPTDSNSQQHGCTGQSFVRSFPGSPRRRCVPSPLHLGKESKSVFHGCRNVAQRLGCHPRLTCRPAQRPHTARRLLQRLAQACGTVRTIPPKSPPAPASLISTQLDRNRVRSLL